MHRPSLRLPGEPGSSPAPWIGANFWSRRGGPLMWRQFSADTVRAELTVLHEHGLTFTRSFFYWPDFMPEPNRVDEECCASYASFLDLHAELGMYTIPTLIVGHMSGENWDPAWRGGRDLYGDVWMVAQQAWFGGEMARRYATHPAVAGSFGLPVVLEEFGLTSDFVSDANGAHFYRQALHNSLLAGATGWGAWNNTDFDGLEHQDPYRHHPFELHFGLTDAQGRPKPQLAELRAFADILAQVDFPRLRRTPAEAALVVSSFLDTEYPFTEPGKDGPELCRTLGQAYVATRLADLPVAIARESDGIGADAKLYLVPSTKQLLTPTWYELADLAADGATVYVSY